MSQASMAVGIAAVCGSSRSISVRVATTPRHGEAARVRPALLQAVPDPNICGESGAWAGPWVAVRAGTAAQPPAGPASSAIQMEIVARQMVDTVM